MVAPMDDEDRVLREIGWHEAMHRLASVSLGRIAFTERALPAIRPVNHIVHDGAIIIRSHEGASIVALADRGRGTVVAYEADEIDPVTHRGWSVVVTGIARIVDDPAEADPFAALLHPWVAATMNHVIRISPEIVSGFEFR